MPVNMNLVRLSNQLEQLKGEVRARRDRAMDDDGHPNSDVFRLKNPEITESMGDWVQARTQEAVKLQKEIDDYLKADGAMNEFDELVDLGKEKTRRAPNPTRSEKSLAQSLVESDEFQKLVRGETKSLVFVKDMGLKTLFETITSGAANSVSAESVRSGDYVSLPRTRVTLLDIIPQLPTTNAQIKYDRESVNLSNAAALTQGDIYQESQFRIDEAVATVVRRGTFIQTSEEALEDIPDLQGRLNGSLMRQLQRRIQSDIIGGAPLPAAEYVGTPVDDTNIEGLLDIAAGTTNVLDGNLNQPSGTFINPFTLVEQAMAMVYSNGEADADAIVMHSNDWVQVATLQSTTGSFIARGALNGAAGATEMSLNGIPVVLCNALPENTVLVGDFSNHAVIRDRQSVRVRIQEAMGVPSQVVDASQPTATILSVATAPNGRYNIFTDARFAYYTRRPLAFCRITDFGVPA